MKIFNFNKFENILKLSIKKLCIQKSTKYENSSKNTKIFYNIKAKEIGKEKGKIDTIRTPGGKRLYNVDKYIKDQTTNKIYNDDNEEELNKLKIIYVRVSSMSQKNDLERQKIYMQKRYPGYLLIEDIGSGLNFNRRGLRKIIKYSIIAVFHKLRKQRND